MADSREIESLRNAYKGYSRAELIRVLHSKVPHCAEHIAAKQVLDEFDEASQRSLFAIGTRTLRWTIVAAVAAVIGAIVAVIAVFH